MRARLLFAVGLLALLGACASDPPPPDRYYRLAPQVPARVEGVEARVRVEPVRAHGVYAERSMLYRQGEAPLQRYYYHLWTATPDLLLSDALVRALQAALGEKQVLEPVHRVVPDLVVHTRLLRLEHLVDGDRPQAALALRFTIQDAAGAPVQSLDFDAVEAASDGSPMAYVQAVERLAARAFAQLAQALAQTPPPPK